MASRVFHAGAFPTGAHHPFMGPEDHSTHPGWATVAGNPQGTLCSCRGLSQASGCLWVSCTLTEEPGASYLLSCPPPPHFVSLVLRPFSYFSSYCDSSSCFWVHDRLMATPLPMVHPLRARN